MTMPSQYPQLMLILLLLATTHTTLAADAEQLPITLAGCPEKCGDISIPFPFGMKDGCFLDGFEVICNYSFTPPRVFLPTNLASYQVGHGIYSSYSWTSDDNSPPPTDPGAYYGNEQMQFSYEPMEIVDISASKSELRVYGAVTSDCLNAGTKFDHQIKIKGTQFNHYELNTSDENPFLLSLLRNVLIGVGPDVKAMMSEDADEQTGSLICYSTISIGIQTNGSCTGGGCCQASFPPESNGRSPIDDFAVTLAHKALVRGAPDDAPTPSDPKTYPTSPCSYGMLVESSWYNFSSEDLFGRLVLPNKHPRGVPFVLDFAIRSGNRSCPAEGQKPPLDYACISGNSSCAKPANGDGYICRCWGNYDGNPYINNGCQGNKYFC